MRSVPISTSENVAGATMLWRWHERLHLTAVVKATFAMVPDRAMTALQPEAIAVDEQKEGKSLRSAGDLVPFRRRTDVVLTGHVLAPRGPARTVTLRFALIREGAALLDKTTLLDIPTRTQAASVLLRDVGPISRHAPGRKDLLRAEDRPLFEGTDIELPAAFEQAYLQAAPVDQRVSGLHGDEWLLIDGVRRDGARLNAQLPGVRAVATLRGAAPGRREGTAIPLAIDTLHVDLDGLVCNLVWRGVAVVADERALGEMQVTASIEAIEAFDAIEAHESFEDLEALLVEEEAEEISLFEDDDPLDRRWVPGVSLGAQKASVPPNEAIAPARAATPLPGTTPVIRAAPVPRAAPAPEIEAPPQTEKIPATNLMESRVAISPEKASHMHLASRAPKPWTWRAEGGGRAAASEVTAVLPMPVAAPIEEPGPADAPAMPPPALLAPVAAIPAFSTPPLPDLFSPPPELSAPLDKTGPFVPAAFSGPVETTDLFVPASFPAPVETPGPFVKGAFSGPVETTGLFVHPGPGASLEADLPFAPVGGSTLIQGNRASAPPVAPAQQGSEQSPSPWAAMPPSPSSVPPPPNAAVPPPGAGVFPAGAEPPVLTRPTIIAATAPRRGGGMTLGGVFLAAAARERLNPDQRVEPLDASVNERW